MSAYDHLQRQELQRRIDTRGTVYPILDPKLELRIALADKYYGKPRSADGFFVDLDI